MKTFAELGPLETRVMTWVWHEPVKPDFTVRDLFQAFEERLAYTTLMTTLDRLYKKGLLNRRKASRAFFYSARVSSEDFGRTRARGLVRSFLRSERDPQPLLACLVDVVTEGDRDLLDGLERLVKEKRRKLRSLE